MTTATILLLNGPNLNLLGQREPHIYGSMSLTQIETRLEKLAAESRARLLCFQSNSEGALIDKIQSAAKDKADFMIVNAAAYSHSSIALRDALAGIDIPYIEVHLSNIYAREPFRHHSHLSALAKGVICGLGPLGYEFALTYALHYLKEKA